MQLLLDGYNVLFAAGAMPRHSGQGELARSREWLLRLLLDHLPPSALRETTVVFDAKNGPRHLPPEYQLHGVRLLFARDHDEADDLIENLIRQHATPKKLTVVTSDLRLRETARRRRCRVIPSDDWLEFIREQQPSTDAHDRTATSQAAPRDDMVAADDIEEWLLFFGQEPQPAGKSTTAPATSKTAVDPEEPRRSTTEAPPRKTAINPPQESASAPAADRGSSPREKPGRTPTPKSPSGSPSPKPSDQPRQGPRGKLRRSPKARDGKASSDREVLGDRESPGWSPFPPGYGEDLLEPPSR